MNLYFSIKKLVAEREEEAEEVIRFMDAVTDIWSKFWLVMGAVTDIIVANNLTFVAVADINYEQTVWLVMGAVININYGQTVWLIMGAVMRALCKKTKLKLEISVSLIHPCSG